MAKMWIVYMPVAGGEGLLQPQARAGAPVAGVAEMGKDRPRFIYHDEGTAMDAATKLAETNPTVPVYILESVKVVETAKPTLLTKLFNKDGELVPLA